MKPGGANAAHAGAAESVLRSLHVAEILVKDEVRDEIELGDELFADGDRDCAAGDCDAALSGAGGGACGDGCVPLLYRAGDGDVAGSGWKPAGFWADGSGSADGEDLGISDEYAGPLPDERDYQYPCGFEAVLSGAVCV
jgi:hypothetical protein